MELLAYVWLPAVIVAYYALWIAAMRDAFAGALGGTLCAALAGLLVLMGFAGAKLTGW